MSMARSGRRLRSQNPCVTRARVRARRRWFLGMGGSKRATLDSLAPETPASSWILVDTFNYTTHGGARIDAHSKIGGEPAGGRRGLVHCNAAGCPRRPSWDSQPQLRPSTQQGKLTRRPDRQTSKCRGQGWGDFKSRQRGHPLAPFVVRKSPSRRTTCPPCLVPAKSPASLSMAAVSNSWGPCLSLCFFLLPAGPSFVAVLPGVSTSVGVLGEGRRGGTLAACSRQLSVDDAGTMHTPDVASTWPESLPHPHATSSFLRQGTISLPEFP